MLYKLAATQNFSQCNGSKTTALPASTCIFNDVTVGNNAVPGESGFGTSGAKYQSTAAYDLATGLGSVNVANLVSKWNTATFRATTTTLALSPTTSIIHGSSVNVNISVAPGSGTGVPTGDVSLLNDDSLISGLGEFFTLSGGSISSTTNSLRGGTFAVCIHTENQNQTSFCLFTLREVSVLAELALGHLRYYLTDVPPQSNSPPVTVFGANRT